MDGECGRDWGRLDKWDIFVNQLTAELDHKARKEMRGRKDHTHTHTHTNACTHTWQEAAW